MRNYKCRVCGARLDPGERCDCMNAFNQKGYGIKKKETTDHKTEKKTEVTNLRGGD